MSGKRKDKKGRVLNTSEYYRGDKDLYFYNFIDETGQRRTVYAKDLDELRLREANITKNMLNGISVSGAANVDVNTVFDRYMETKIALRSTTYSNYILLYDRFIRDGFGKKKIRDVKYSDVMLFYVALTEKGIAKGTLININAMLSGTFKLALRDALIGNNPVVGALSEIKGHKCKEKRVVRPLTLAEERRFLKLCDEPRYKRLKPMFIIMFGTGLRSCELFSLTWDDVDLENKLIYVNKGITYAQRADSDFRREYRISDTKTQAGNRKVPMLDEVKEAFLLEKNYQDILGEDHGYKVDGIGGFIFNNLSGKPLNTTDMNARIRRMITEYNHRETEEAKAAGRDPELIPIFTCHATRHTFCTRLCENGTNIKLIQKIMGHSTIKTTLDIYADVMDDVMPDMFGELNGKDVL